MKRFINKWVYSFAVLNIIFIFITLIINRRLNIEMPFLKLGVGAACIATFTALSIMLFMMKQGNSLIKIILGFIVLLPAPYILRSLFGVIIFRFSFVIYLIALLCTSIYAIAIFVVITQTKKNEQLLNRLLNETKQNKNI